MARPSERWQELKSQFMAWMAQGAKDLHNQIVPAFPTYVHGVDQPNTPLNMPESANPNGVLFDPAKKPSFEEVTARQAPPPPSQEPSADKGMEL